MRGELKGQQVTVIELQAAKADLGKVIGKQGGQRTVLEIFE